MNNILAKPRIWRHARVQALLTDLSNNCINAFWSGGGRAGGSGKSKPVCSFARFVPLTKQTDRLRAFHFPGFAELDSPDGGRAKKKRRVRPTTRSCLEKEDQPGSTADTSFLDLICFI